MKAFISSLFLFVALSLAAFAGGFDTPFHLIDSVDVGSCASEVFTVSKYDGYVYAICLGYDQNSNGTEDEGDVRPSLWKINYGSDIHSSGAVVKLAEFAFNSLILPVRYDKRSVSGNSFLLLPFINNIVCEINLATGEIVRNYHVDGLAVDAKYDGDHFWVCVQDEQDSPGKILKYNLATGSKVATLVGGVNLQESIVLPGGVLGSLSVGVAGTDDSELWLRRVSESAAVSDSISIHLGVNGSSLYNDESNRLYATVYGSHKVMEIDLFNPFGQLEIDTLLTGTTGLEGPRQTFALPLAIFTTTYAGRLNIYEGGSKTPTNVVNIPGKLEGICGVGSNLLSMSGHLDLLFVASPFTNDFGPNNKIYLVEGGNTSVYEPLASANFRLYPVPATEAINVEFTNGITNANVEIRDLFGRSVKTLNGDGPRLTINVYDLVPGSYFAIISAEGRMWSAPFTVAR